MLNVYDAGLTAFIQSLAERAGADERREKLAFLLTVALKKALLKEASCFEEMTALPSDAPDWLQEKFGTEPIHAFNAELLSAVQKDQINHVKDWLHAALVQQRETPDASHLAWLKSEQCDDKGRPKKLLKLGTLQQANAEADKEMRKNTMRLRQTVVSYDTIEADPYAEVVRKFDDGYCIVRITDKMGLDAEGAEMGHCVGNGAYDDGIETGTIQIYSLRDPQNRPHTTLEVDVESNTLVQCKGKADQIPNEEYYPYLYKFIKSKKYELKESCANTGLIQQDDNYYSIFSLPEGFVYQQKTALDLSSIKRPILFPQNMHVWGELILNPLTAHLNMTKGTLPYSKKITAPYSKIIIPISNTKLNNVLLPDGTIIPALRRWDDQCVLYEQLCYTDRILQDIIKADGTVIPAVQYWNNKGILTDQKCYSNGKLQDIIKSDGTIIPALQGWHDNGKLFRQECYSKGERQDIIKSDGTVIPAVQYWNDKGILTDQSYYTTGQLQDIVLANGTIIPAFQLWNDQGVLIRQTYFTNGVEQDGPSAETLALSEERKKAYAAAQAYSQNAELAEVEQEPQNVMPFKKPAGHGLTG